MSKIQVIKPHDLMIEEGGMPMGWLASVWTRERIVEEYDYCVDDTSKFVEQHYAARWTTEAERADPDLLYDLFGGDPEDFDTTVHYWRVSADWRPKNQHQQGPFLYYELP